MSKALITGGSGFLGRIIASKFKDIVLLGRNSSNDIVCDLSREIPEFTEEYDIIIHNAGKAHSVPKNESEENIFFNVNFLGSKNLCEGIDRSFFKPKFFVFVSTVAVYGVEIGTDISEDSELLGSSPYARSKILAEELIVKWGDKNNVPVLILRLPLVVAENPPGNLGKMIKGIKNKTYFSINNGKARRSMVLADDVANCIAENIGKKGIYNLTDRCHPTFYDLELVISRSVGAKMPLSIPFFFASMVGKIGNVISFFPINSSVILKMSCDLTFNDSKAVMELNWKPKSVIDNFQI